jgi:NAD(P)-dependent dehydrogenase (short-subunit alcohol dehydrogenase family)
MPEPNMSMNRAIHAAFRRDLARFDHALAAFSDGDRERARGLQRAWENFDKQLTHHHESEHEIGWPAMRDMGFDPAKLDVFDEEHDRMAEALAETRGAMQRFAVSASRGDADAAAASMSRLRDVTVTHLDHEEEETESLFAANAGNPAMKEMSRKYGRSLSLGEAGVYFAWLDDGAADEVRAALRRSIPGPVITIIGGLLGRRYRKEIAPVWS